MAAETGFTIDGEIYPVVSIEMFDLDEGEIFYDRTGLLVEDFIQEEGESEQDYERRMRVARTPRFWATMMFLAYRRKHRDESAEAIWAVIGRQNQMQGIRSIVSAEDDALPPELTTKPAEPLPSETETSSILSGSASSGSSTEPDDQQPTTGTSGSGTSSTADRPSLVA